MSKGLHPNQLSQWGISSQTADHFALHWIGYGFIFPTLDGHRKRILLANPKPNAPKVIWDKKTAHLPMPPLFNIGCLPEAQGTVYVVNGEKSTLAHWTAGVHNTINTYGEGNRVAEAVELLKAHGIQNVIVIPDCDKHGLIAALKWQEACRAAHLEIHIRDLRLYLATTFGMTPQQYHKWDTRDLWLLLKQDAMAFRQALDSLPELDFQHYADELPAPTSAYTAAAPLRPKHRADQAIDWLEMFEKWKREIVLPALDRVSPPPQRGKHRHCPNPHHADRHPSFRIGDKGVPLCTCEPKITWHRLAEWVGAQRWEDYRRDQLAHHKPPDSPPKVNFGAPLRKDQPNRDQRNQSDLIRLNTRFLTAADLDLTAPHVHALRSSIGTGKTEAIIRSIGENDQVLLISHRIALAGSLHRRLNEQHRLGFQHYQEFQGALRSQLHSAPRLIITPNSLHKLLSEDGKLPLHYDLLILDEAEQILEHLAGDTFTGMTGPNTLAILSRLVSSTPRVIAADAGLTHLTVSWLKGLRSDIRRIWNTFIMQRGEMTLYERKAPVLLSLLEDLYASPTPIVIATDSKNQAKDLHRLLSNYDFRGLCIHADNRDTPENAAFLANIDQQISHFDYLIHSPTIDAGVDIQAEIETVYGIFLNRSITADKQLQMLGRARKARRFVIFSAQVGERAPVSPYYIKQQYIRTLIQHAHKAGLPLEWDGAGNIVLDSPRDAYLSLVTAVEAKRNQMLNSAHAFFKWLASREYRLTRVEPEETLSVDTTQVSQILTTARKMRRDEEMQLTLNSQPVAEDEYRQLQFSSQATQEVVAGHLRWRIESFYRQPIHEDLYKEAINRSTGGMIRLERFILMHKPFSALRQADLEETRGEGMTADHRRKLHALRLPLIKAVLVPVFGTRLTTQRISEQELHERLIEFEREYHKLDIRRIFHRRTNHVWDDPQRERLKLLRWVLSLIGLRLKLWRGRNGKREYSIDPGRYEQLIQLANIRLEGIGDDLRITPGMWLGDCDESTSMSHGRASASIADEMHDSATHMLDPPESDAPAPT